MAFETDGSTGTPPRDERAGGAEAVAGSEGPGTSDVGAGWPGLIFSTPWIGAGAR
jgi:hypothetical protein